jgi:hypothetical protein
MKWPSLAAVALVTASLTAWSEFSTVAVAQSCNSSPSQPSSATARRFVGGPVKVEWTVPGNCEPERFYLEASRGVDEIIEETVDDGSERSVELPLGANNGTPWRITIRAFNEFGLSAGRHAFLSEGPIVPVENLCPLGEIPRPTLVSAQAFGRTLVVQWQPDGRCPVAITGFVIGGSAAPDGLYLGTVTVPYPNARSWTGDVPSGSYYVSVVAQYYGVSSTPSNAMLVHVP